MRKNRRMIITSVFLFLGLSCLGGCSSSDGSHATSDAQTATAAANIAGTSGENAGASDSHRETITDVTLPEESGTITYGNEAVSIDASNTADGYVMIRYQGASDMAKLQITIPDETVYTYTLLPDTDSAFPLSGGDGTYSSAVLEHAYDNMYAMAFSQEISVTLADEFRPFLCPNQYVWYTKESQTVQLGISLSDQSADDLDYVQNVYNYVIEHITYDKEAAANISANYIPDVDATLASGKGICFDYASLMTAMLRSQGIPTRLDVGYSGTAYHAWISVYLKESGWVSGIIEFDGKNWTLMDPTLAASNSSKEVKKYIGDGSNYTVKYVY